MRLAHIACTAGLLLVLSACAEEAQCVDRTVRGNETVVVQCSTGKVPVCGDEPEILYNMESGALLPVTETPDLSDPAMRAAYTGSCDGVVGPCRPRPVCRGSSDESPTCANGETAFCLLGRVDEIMTMMPPPPPEDGGPGETDAGPGETDAGPGETDAGPGETDAGPGDAGTDAGTDAGP